MIWDQKPQDQKPRIDLVRINLSILHNEIEKVAAYLYNRNNIEPESYISLHQTELSLMLNCTDKGNIDEGENERLQWNKSYNCNIAYGNCKNANIVLSSLFVDNFILI